MNQTLRRLLKGQGPPQVAHSGGRADVFLSRVWGLSFLYPILANPPGKTQRYT